jgi:hypothetical protein
MAEQDTNGAAATEQDSLLDALGSLREQRAAETTTDLPLPGFAGRLWATFRLPDAGKVTQLSTFMAAGARQLTGEARKLHGRAPRARPRRRLVPAPPARP